MLEIGIVMLIIELVRVIQLRGKTIEQLTPQQMNRIQTEVDRRRGQMTREQVLEKKQKSLVVLIIGLVAAITVWLLMVIFVIPLMLENM
ncbi:MAG: hypothetical protein FWD89_02880 [Firmicutes bacterium]|nr:hypothetical protein [Bacillota bacterium]